MCPNVSVYAWALSLTGDWIGGRAKSESYLTVLAWSNVPSALSLIFYIPIVLFFGKDIINTDIEFENILAEIAFAVLGLAAVILGIWSLVILVKGIALIQDFSIGQAILNALLPVIIVLIPTLFFLLMMQ